MTSPADPLRPSALRKTRPAALPLTAVTGVILAGGRSSRYGSNKALAEYNGVSLIRRVAAVLEPLFPERLLVTNSPASYRFLGWPLTHDRYPGLGPLAGIHAALTASKTDWVFVCGCDMPLVSPALIHLLLSLADNRQAVVPFTRQGPEPLHALYHRRIAPLIEAHLTGSQRKVGRLLTELDLCRVEEPLLRTVVPDLSCFHNINRPEDLALLPTRNQS